MDKIFGMAERSLMLSEQRATIISSNLVNSSTPNYKAKDFDFDKAMQTAERETAGSLEATQPNHIKSSGDHVSGVEIQYRIPMQYSMDGNTVDPEIERKNFLSNSLKYQASLTFVQNKTDQLMKAIKGE